MKISIQPSALADLRIGFQFYEKQQIGLGGYFIDSLYSDIDSLLLYAGYILGILANIDFFQTDSHMPSIINSDMI